VVIESVKDSPTGIKYVYLVIQTAQAKFQHIIYSICNKFNAL